MKPVILLTMPFRLKTDRCWTRAIILPRCASFVWAVHILVHKLFTHPVSTGDIYFRRNLLNIGLHTYIYRRSDCTKLLAVSKACVDEFILLLHLTSIAQQRMEYFKYYISIVYTL